ncbi:MAG: hypothetical protein WDN24_07080 [Sphingomonas sp.]
MRRLGRIAAAAGSDHRSAAMVAGLALGRHRHDRRAGGDGAADPG